MTTHAPHVTVKLESAVKPVTDEPRKAKVKFKIHLCAITLAGIVFAVLFHYNVENHFLLAFAPLVPGAFQEVLDMLKRL